MVIALLLILDRCVSFSCYTLCTTQKLIPSGLRIQFTQLGSPRKVVVDNAIEDLKYHCEMLDRMGIGKEGVMIIHVSLKRLSSHT